MRIFNNKNIGINVLAVVVAVGSNALCQRKQSAPNKLERLIETPDGKGKEVYFRADNPNSSRRNGEKHEGTTSTSVTSKSEEYNSGIVSGGDHRKISSSSQEGLNSPQSNVSEIPGNLKYFVSLDCGRLVIASESELWGDGKFAYMLGGQEELLVLSVCNRKFLFSNSVDGEVEGTIETILLKIRKQSSSEDFFVFIVIASIGDREGATYDVLTSETIDGLKDRIYASSSLSLVQCAIGWVRHWKGFEKIKGATVHECSSGNNGTYQYNANVFSEFE